MSATPQCVHVVALQPDLRWQHSMANMFNLRQIVESLPQVADIVVLPEAWSGLIQQQWDESRTAESTQFLTNIARAADVNIIGGTIVQQGEQTQPQVVALVIHRSGRIVGRYAKQTLFAHEQDQFAPGTESEVFDLDGLRVAVLICADLWRAELTRDLRGKIDLLCVPAKTAVPSDVHVSYARQLWHGLALTRSMENGFPVIVSDWAAGRHTPGDIDRSAGSAHAPGMAFDRGALYKRHRDPDKPPTSTGPLRPTAMAPSSVAPALGPEVHYTAGAATICDPGRRPDILNTQLTIVRGEAGHLRALVDLNEVERFREYRKSVGLLPG